ncbi:MAG: SsrA-binding protein SmpB [Acidobacteria bacterium]|nr:SsrA-binding protein SmpB [Acidobacteriota bacterium]
MEGIKIAATNRQASHLYDLLETHECGAVLTGTEVKSIREAKINLKDAYAMIRNGEAWLVNAHISPYTHGNRTNHEPTRTRKLLLHKSEIRKLAGKTQERGLTLIPTKCYLKAGRVKFEIALAKGRKLHDKREAIAKKSAARETLAALKERNR